MKNDDKEVYLNIVNTKFVNNSHNRFLLEENGVLWSLQSKRIRYFEDLEGEKHYCIKLGNDLSPKYYSVSSLLKATFENFYFTPVPTMPRFIVEVNNQVVLDQENKRKEVEWYSERRRATILKLRNLLLLENKSAEEDLLISEIIKSGITEEDAMDGFNISKEEANIRTDRELKRLIEERKREAEEWSEACKNMGL